MKVVYAGSFDPITLGHISVIERAGHLFDEVHVVIANNRNKKHQFTIEQRTAMVKLSISHMTNAIVVPFEGITADYVNENGIVAVIRGIRNSTDLEYELQLEQYMRSTSNADTIYLSPYTKDIQTSSSLVRMFILSNKIDKAKDYMHPDAYHQMVSFIQS
ncbi:phosphopantetheine adenylyltransferase [Paenibacillus cellulosilyticus]|uniref:Phosphopantetheine adenylyltransferase n=1 Tax=Paenibacillus cellulosilyticus TaxID=375489 RepID=A0A2V2YUH2_9BACL|nr:pantetheine-phosphate adenylyltransferase [Paenibacillus cellulosilyticus]PWW04811.1 phosphopantetheine adenylyltransferase [Paenibacillus cellulosilyticus]QKS45931.1 pantetheine-phosphate adenylyltransferase [Paenibacillus cellulosilyticus]